MRGSLSLPPLLLTIMTLPGVCSGQSGATTTVIANPSTITIGGTVGLTATVQPENVTITPGQVFTKPTGTITFLDGSTPLNAAVGRLAFCFV
jgi:hypothetical protein